MAVLDSPLRPPPSVFGRQRPQLYPEVSLLRRWLSRPSMCADVPIMRARALTMCAGVLIMRARTLVTHGLGQLTITERK